MSCTHEPLGQDFSTEHFNGDIQKDFASQMMIIAEMNNKGVESMERSSDFANAAAYFYGSLNLALTASEITFIPPKVFSNVNSGIRDRSEMKNSEYDEGMGSLSVPVKIGPSNKSMALSASTILFNVGVLNLQRHEDAESLYCFSQALHIANQQGDFPVVMDDKRIGGVDIVTILHNIGFALYRSGSYEDAIRTYTNLLNILRESRTPSCCSLLHAAATLNCLGVVHYHASKSDPKISLDFCVESLATRRAVIGQDADDKAVATTLNNIGRIHFLKGALSEAIEMYKYSLNMRRRLFGDDHVDVAATICNIGQAYHLQGNPVEAMKFYNEFVMIAKGSFGYIHRDVAVVLKCMAQIHMKWGDYEKATFLYEEAISVGKATHGPCEEIASILNQLGSLFHKKGDLDRALSIYMEGLQVEREVFDEAHPNVAVTLSNIGSIYMSRQAYQPALCFYSEALIIQRQVFGNSHPKIASALSCIAMIHFRNQSYAEALAVYQEVLFILHDTYGEDHIEVALTLNSIALAFSKMNLRKHALEYFEKSLRIRRALLGNNHHSLAVIMFNIGAIYLELGQEEDADTYYHEALCVERHNVQKGNNVSKSHLAILQHIALTHQQRGDIGEAIKYLSEKLEVQTMGGDKQDASAIAQTLSSIGSLYLQTGQTADMVAVMSNALRYIRLTGKDESDLDLSGLDLYSISKCHPECAAVA